MGKFLFGRLPHVSDLHSEVESLIGQHMVGIQCGAGFTDSVDNKFVYAAVRRLGLQAHSDRKILDLREVFEWHLLDELRVRHAVCVLRRNDGIELCTSLSAFQLLFKARDDSGMAM